MKRFLFTVVLLLGFLFNSGFNYGPDEDPVRYGRDSTTLEVTFQNPRVIVSDERTGEAIASYFDGRDSMYNNVLEFLEVFAEDFMSLSEKDQERRYESAMDYLSRRLEIPPDKVNEIITEHSSRQNKLYLIFTGMIIILAFVAWYRDTRSIKSSSDRLVDVVWVLLISVALYLLCCSILRIVTPDELDYIKNLTQLSG